MSWRVGRFGYRYVSRKTGGRKYLCRLDEILQLGSLCLSSNTNPTTHLTSPLPPKQTAHQPRTTDQLQPLFGFLHNRISSPTLTLAMRGAERSKKRESGGGVAASRSDIEGATGEAEGGGA